jgi:hypothetical protein
MKKNQERRLHRKNAKIVKEGGTPMTLHRPIKPDTTVCNSLLVRTLLTEFAEALRSLWSDGSHEYTPLLFFPVAANIRRRNKSEMPPLG